MGAIACTSTSSLVHSPHRCVKLYKASAVKKWYISSLTPRCPILLPRSDHNWPFAVETLQSHSSCDLSTTVLPLLHLRWVAQKCRWRRHMDGGRKQRSYDTDFELARVGFGHDVSVRLCRPVSLLIAQGVIKYRRVKHILYLPTDLSI